MTKKIKVILTCFKQTSYEDYTHFFKKVKIGTSAEKNIKNLVYNRRS